MTNIKLNSMQPIDDGGRKYNKIYVIMVALACVLGIYSFFVKDGDIGGMLLFLVLSLGIGWTIKNELLNIKAYSFRNYTFQLSVILPYDVLINNIIPELTMAGMRVERGTDGNPVIIHKKMIYDITYNDDNTFSIWWRKTIAGALMHLNAINMYRDISADMGIIGFVIQKTSDSSVSRGEEKQEQNIKEDDNVLVNNSQTIKEEEKVEEPVKMAFCSSCGSKISEGAKFCGKCGKAL